jgi:hypothetical protein
VVDGYEGTQLVNLCLQLILKEEMERLLDDNGFVFSDDRNLTACFVTNVRKYLLCGPTINRQWSISTKHSKRRAWHQTHVIVNSTGRWHPSSMMGLLAMVTVRLKLPTYVLTGIQELFTNPDAIYTGHRKLE